VNEEEELLLHRTTDRGVRARMRFVFEIGCISERLSIKQICLTSPRKYLIRNRYCTAGVDRVAGELVGGLHDHNQEAVNQDAIQNLWLEKEDILTKNK